MQNGKKVTRTEKTTVDSRGRKVTEVTEKTDDGRGNLSTQTYMIEGEQNSKKKSKMLK